MPYPAGLRQVTRAQQLHQGHETRGLPVRAGGDCTVAAQGQGGEHQRIFARQHGQAPVRDQCLGLGCIAAAVLDGADAWVFGQCQQGVGGQRGACAVGDVVDDQRRGAGVGQGAEPQQQPVLRWADVVRCRYQQACQGVLRQGLHPFLRLAQVVARQAHHHGQAL